MKTYLSKVSICLIFASCLIFLALTSAFAGQRSYQIEKIATGIYAALALPDGGATSNALIVDLGYNQIIVGAHLTKKAINDLLAAAAEITPKPVEAFVLAHHHQGFSFVDFDFPPGREIFMTVDARQVMKQEVRSIDGQISYFKEGLTLEGIDRSLVLSNIGGAHSKGDLIAYIPQTKTLFTSDLVYVNNAGFLGDGPLRNWVMALDGILQLDANTVIPGYGPVSTLSAIRNFRDYLRAFLTETLRHIEQKDDLYTTRKNFALPKYENLPGYKRFRQGNIERAYQQLSKP